MEDQGCQDAFLENLKTVNPSQSHFIMKIQIVASVWGHLVVQNRKMSVNITLEMNTESAKMLIRAIKIKGVKGVLGFFAAFDKDYKIFIYPEIQPVETW